MSHPSRTRARNQQEARRRRHQLRIEAVQPLEDRQLLAPVVPTMGVEVEFTAAPDPVDNTFLGTVNIVPGEALPGSAAPFVSVSQLTPISQFGNQIVRIEAGPGGDFGKGVYAITRGINSGATGATGGRPGVIYRVDPATGDASLFFDLNTVVDQIQPGDDASTTAGVETGLVNWYDIAFDAEGYFDGLPSMFVSTVDITNPFKNTIYRIAPDGTFLGLFAQFTGGLDNGGLNRRPSAIHVPPVEQQQFLRGLVVGEGNRDLAFTGLFFDANVFSPGQEIVGPTLPRGVFRNDLSFSPQVGLTSANPNYLSRVYSAFTDFGVRGIPDFSPAAPGFSGVQGIATGELLIGTGTAPVTESLNPDAESAISTPFRRFQDITFDHFGYFSYGSAVTPGPNGTLPTIATPVYVGSLFVSDLATGLALDITPIDPLPTDSITVPIQGPGPIGVAPNPVTGVIEPITVAGRTTSGNLGGRIVRIAPDGTVSVFAEGFNTSGRQDSGSFIESSLSITFSADGTTLYASDNDGIWQFKSVLSLAGSATGQLVGLNDLRNLGVPFQGEDTAVAVLDTGVDARTPPLRGRVAEGRNVLTRGRGDDDLSANPNGHGTLVAGVISQFVPQTTIQPVNLFSPLLLQPGALGDAPITNSQAIFEALRYTADNPFVRDPVRPGQLNRVVTAALGFGTIETFDAEGTAFRAFPQLTIAFKNQLHRFRQLGITPVAAAGQLGIPFGQDENPFGEFAGDVDGMTLPAVLNEVVSVTGTYSIPFEQGPNSPPTDPISTVLGRSFGPPALFPDPADILASPIPFPGNLGPITEGDVLIYQDKILASANRGYLTDFAAPAINVPTFRRTEVAFGPDNLVFDEGGTSLSAGIVAGSFTLVASALDFYNELATKGFTANSYLTQPVGARVLNFGPHVLRNLEVYSNPDAINAILQWTAVPITDADIPGADVIFQPLSRARPEEYREFARVDVGNALAAIEGSIALHYLIATGGLQMIDSNNNGLITAQELQRFIDIAPAAGLAEIGAMARLLGGTARPPGEVPEFGNQNFVTAQVDGGPLGVTIFGEQPDRFDVLQRRFNYFDYAANGQLDGVISIDQLYVLAHTLLPPADSFVIVDRQRASANGFQLDPTAPRNIADLQRVLPTYAFVPRGIVARFRGVSPRQFGVDRGIDRRADIPSLTYTLFDRPEQRQAVQANRQARRNQAASPPPTAVTPPPVTPPAQAEKVDPKAVDSLLSQQENERNNSQGSNSQTTQQEILQTLREMALNNRKTAP